MLKYEIHKIRKFGNVSDQKSVSDVEVNISDSNNVMMNPRVWQHVILCSSFPRTFLLKPNPNDPTSVWRRQRTMLVLTLTALVLCITVHTAECGE